MVVSVGLVTDLRSNKALRLNVHISSSTIPIRNSMPIGTNMPIVTPRGTESL